MAGIYARNADGSGSPQQILSGHGTNYTGAWTPDGTRLIAVPLNPRTGFDIVVVPVSGDSAGQPLMSSQYSEGYPAISPDGRWLAYVTEETGRSEVYVRRFPGLGGRVQVSLNSGSEPVWSRDGRELIYRGGGRDGAQIVAARVETAPTFQVVSRTPLFSAEHYETAAPHTNYDVDPKGNRFVMVRHHGSSELILVQNWPEQLDAQ
ncbi:MAG TPA: hypothetical protein VFU40_06670 [Gemmatimonadales bacterium]|nr:hypothetical protein [Gemmatimonadales bacterium]